MDPEDPDKVLVRRLVQINAKVYAYEETRMAKREDGSSEVHTTLCRLGHTDIKEDIDDMEKTIR